LTFAPGSSNILSKLSKLAGADHDQTRHSKTA
jgi:hypothetical protein